MWALCKLSCSHTPISQYQSLDSAPAAGRYQRAKKVATDGLPNLELKDGEVALRPAHHVEKLAAEWIRRRIKNHRLSDVFPNVMNVSLEWINAQKIHVRMCDHTITHTKSVESHQTHWGTASVDVVLIPIIEAATCWRCAAQPCKRPAPWVHVFAIILLWHQISLKRVRKKKKERQSIQFPAAEDINATIVCFISKLCEVLRGKMKEDQVC